MIDTPIELVTRTDPRVEMFVAQARTLGEQNAKIVFGHYVYCDLFNEPLLPENQIFALRPAKRRELRVNDARLWSNVGERQAFDVLYSMSRKAFPELISGFRICLDTACEGGAVLLDEIGRRSASRPVDYFRPLSSRTFYRRCIRLDVPFWRGSDDLLRPFFEYCVRGFSTEAA
jgi:hypothetical protein